MKKYKAILLSMITTTQVLFGKGVLYDPFDLPPGSEISSVELVEHHIHDLRRFCHNSYFYSIFEKDYDLKNYSFSNVTSYIEREGDDAVKHLERSMIVALHYHCEMDNEWRNYGLYYHYPTLFKWDDGDSESPEVGLYVCGYVGPADIFLDTEIRWDRESFLRILDLTEQSFVIQQAIKDRDIKKVRTLMENGFIYNFHLNENVDLFDFALQSGDESIIKMMMHYFPERANK